MVFIPFIKGSRPMPCFHLSCPFSHLELHRPKPKLQHPRSSSMSGSDVAGRWVASSIQEEDIAKLREVGYLTADIQHRLPAPGQVIPTPELNESVVFTPHFLRGLGLTLDPFVRGLMFYYGLDFHDLAPDPSSISRLSLLCARLFSTSPHTSAYGSRPSM